MKNAFIPGPRYEAARRRFLESLPGTFTQAQIISAKLAWGDTTQAAHARFLDARDDLCRDIGKALWFPQAFARLKYNLKGEK